MLHARPDQPVSFRLPRHPAAVAPLPVAVELPAVEVPPPIAAVEVTLVRVGFGVYPIPTSRGDCPREAIMSRDPGQKPSPQRPRQEPSKEQVEKIIRETEEAEKEAAKHGK